MEGFDIQDGVLRAEFREGGPDRREPRADAADAAYPFAARDHRLGHEPGDALAWNHRTLHAASGNTQDRKRRSLAIIYLGDDIRYNAALGATDRRWDTTVLEDGAPMTSAAYPQVL